MKAKDFSLPDQNGNKKSLKDYKGKYVILYFYPKDNTPGCTTEANEFTKLSKEFNKLGAEIIGVSPDSCGSHERFIKKHNLKITLLSDEKHELAKKYDAYGKKKFMGREYEGIIRSTFIISPEREIIKEWRNVKAKGHAEEVLKTLKEIIKEKE